MSAPKLQARVTRIVVVPANEPLYSERATTVDITDESGGEFVEVSQHGDVSLGKIQINPEDWPKLRAAINRLVRDCRDLP